MVMVVIAMVLRVSQSSSLSLGEFGLDCSVSDGGNQVKTFMLFCISSSYIA